MVMRTFLRGCKEGVHLFGQNIALIINAILLMVVYILGVGLTSVIAKICGKHFLERRVERGKDGSYWQELNLKKRPIEEYYRQF